MASVHNHENYYSEDPLQPSRLKRLARSFGRAASNALFRLKINPKTSLNSEVNDQLADEVEVEQGTGRSIKLPAIYDYENSRKTQPVYYGKIYDRKGEQVIPLDLLWQHDMLIAIYSLSGNTDRRYLVVQKVPDLKPGDSSPAVKVKFSEVYEKPQAEEKFRCKNRDSDFADPELTRSLIIGGNYGAGSKLVAVLGLDPEHEVAFSDESTQEERSLAYSLYQVERALLTHETKINSRFI